jgi:hypothetical protein
VLVLVVCALSFVAHESAHALAGHLLGYDMAMSLNQAWPRSERYASSLHAWLVTAAGPAFTIGQAAVAYAVLRVRPRPSAYAVLFCAAFIRLAAAGVSLFHPNDEARLSSDWGLGLWTLPAIVVLALVGLTWDASRRLRVGWRANVLAYIACSVACVAVVWLDGYVLAAVRPVRVESLSRRARLAATPYTGGAAPRARIGASRAALRPQGTSGKGGEPWPNT